MLQNKILLLLVLYLFTLGSANANANENAKKVKASIDEATVFFTGAELVHKGSSTLTKGVNEIWITDLSPSIDINSLKISATRGVIVASHEYSQDFVTLKEVSRLEKSLQDSVKYYKKVIREYQISTKTNLELLELLKANNSIAGTQTGLNVAELIKMVDYYSAKSNELNKQQTELSEKSGKATENLRRIEAQLQQESAKNIKSMGILKLNLTSPMATTTDFTITYYTRNAGWVPYYDINVPGTDKQIQIASKAKVAQTTGLDWSKVKLALSTAAPSTNREAPLFSAWFLDFNQYLNNSGQLMGAISVAQNRYSYKDLPIQNHGSTSSIRGGNVSGSSSVANVQPLYVVNGSPVTNEEFKMLSPDMIENMEVLKDASSTALYGANAAGGVILVTTKSMSDFVKRDEGDLNMVYNIDLPYTIQGNGKMQNIDLQLHSISADFKHYTIPKLDKEVFVLAEIADWQKLGLLSGKANVTFDGTYVGETTINASSVAPKLTLTLGTDKRVTVKREKLQDFSSKKFLGKDTRQDFTYKISVRNNQNKSIKMVLKDQYPLSKQKEIQVELLKETTPTTYVNEEVGVLNWEFELGAGESKEFKVAYSVKYPKDKSVNL